jgi:hypothetical protein
MIDRVRQHGIGWAVLLAAGLVWMALGVGCGEPIVPAYCPPAAYDAFEPGRLAPIVRRLADPRLGGRMAGTAGNGVAARGIAEQFAQAGLIPAGEGGTYRRRFPLARLRVGAHVSSLRADEESLVFGQDFLPSAAGARGTFAGPIVFAGFGVKNRVRGYNDYRNLSAHGAVVLIVQGEPHDDNGQSLWAPKGKWTELIALPRKLRLAREAGAVAALVVTPPALRKHGDPLADVLPPRRRGPIPAVRISRQAANRLLAAGGRSETVDDLARVMRDNETFRGFPLDLRVEGTCDFVPGVGENLIGVLPAGKHYPTTHPADATDDETFDDGLQPPVVVIGAHYDHLPATGQKARDAGFGARPGADDNATGVALLCQLAEALSNIPERNCEYVFVAFDAEEIGFLGSKQYVEHPARPLDRTVLMVNLDQLGRLRDEEVLVIGKGDSLLSRVLTDGNSLGAGLKLTRVPAKRWSPWSADAPFASRGIPTLLFTTGLHRDSRTRRDRFEKVDIDGLARAGRLVFDTLRFFDEAHAPKP